MQSFHWELPIKRIKNNNSPQKYKATNTLISYIQLGFPVTPKRMLAKGNHINIAFGLRPVTRINYKILADKNLVGIDSVTTLYEGTGGISQANFSTGVKIKNFSFGASTGYSFGNRQNSTKLILKKTDSARYMQSNTEADARFGGFFLTLGAQYGIRLKNKNVLRLGVSTNLTRAPTTSSSTSATAPYWPSSTCPDSTSGRTHPHRADRR